MIKKNFNNKWSNNNPKSWAAKKTNSWTNRQPTNSTYSSKYKTKTKPDFSNKHWPEKDCWAGSRILNYRVWKWQCVKCGKFSPKPSSEVKKFWEELVEISGKNKQLSKAGKLELNDFNLSKS